MDIDTASVSTTIATAEPTVMEAHSAATTTTASATTPALSFPHMARRNSINNATTTTTTNTVDNNSLSGASSTVGMSTAALLALTKVAHQGSSLPSSSTPSVVTAIPLIMHTHPAPSLSTDSATQNGDQPVSSTFSTASVTSIVRTDQNPVAADTQTDLQRMLLHHQQQQEDEATKREQTQQQNRERAIELVLRQSKIHKVSRRLRSRLEFAILKIRRGWSKYTLQEVESLYRSSPTTRTLNFSSASSASASSTSPSPPPLPSSMAEKKKRKESSKTSKKVTESIVPQPSTIPSSFPTRQSGRKRVRRVYQDYEQPADLHSSQEPEEKQEEVDEYDQRWQSEEPVRRRSRRLSQSTSMAAVAASSVKEEDYGSTKGRRRGRPSYSQFKDAELFSPAQSLMDIATSSSPATSPLPSPRLNDLQQEREPYLVRHPFSPYGYTPSGSSRPVFKNEHPSSAYSASVPNSPRMQSNDYFANNGDGNDDGTDAQAAETILMLASSPTRSATRSLNPAYSNPQHQPQGYHHHDHHHYQRGLTASPVMHHAELPFIPTISSPLVQYPARSPIEEEDENPFMPKAKRAYNRKAGSSKISSSTKKGATTPKKSGTSSSKKETLASLYGKKQKDFQQLQQAPEEMTIPLPSDSSTVSALVSSSRAVTPPPRSSSTSSSSTTPAHGIQTPPPSGSKELGAPHNLPSSSARINSRSGSPTANKTAGGSGGVSSIRTRRMSSGLSGGSGGADNSMTTDLTKIYPIPPPIYGTRRRSLSSATQH